MLAPERDLFRVVRDGHGPWWFGSTLQGRFDLPAPAGTCYAAGTALDALLELLGPDLLPGGIAPSSLLAGRHIRRLHVPRAIKLANPSIGAAARWVTAELATLTPYDLPQAWAAALQRDGFRGVRYTPRHNPSRRAVAYALFGKAGERSWSRGQRIAISRSHLDRLRKGCGITLFETPFADELEFAGDPV